MLFMVLIMTYIFAEDIFSLKKLFETTKRYTNVFETRNYDLSGGEKIPGNV